jgi:DNA-binding transcriptional LysR family regulator
VQFENSCEWPRANLGSNHGTHRWHRAHTLFNSTFLPAVIDRLSRKFPRLMFHVISVPPTTPRHLEVLHERTVDLAMSYLTQPFEHDDLTAELLYSDAMTVAAAPHSKWARRRKIELAELVDEPWCLPMNPFALGVRGSDGPRSRGCARDGARTPVFNANGCVLFQT